MKYICPAAFILAALLIITCAGSSAADENKDDAARAAFFKNIKTLLEKADSYSVFEFIQTREDPVEAAEIYSDLVSDFYWKDKDLHKSISFAGAGIQYCLIKAGELETIQPETAEELKDQAKVISYNLASFAWPGWDEEGIVIGSTEIAAGLDAAWLNLRLVRELNKDNLELSNAWWVVGAQLLASQKYDEAVKAFESSMNSAHLASDRINKLLAQGFVGTAMIVGGNEDGHQILGNVIKALSELNSEEGRFVIDQLNTALNVFIK
jgi:hypothetical protein